ncbi:hypothetical protein BY996DRAFT_7431740 [Phakopsora pachyrhizi]|uniref:Secreted protein n=1 Tax=Phakopsora pachyrhizi TaxID=170000 RepID=A0A0S1MIV1_PHAPC|nr:hypothetical protein BY996DRAFT_7431740 [Phakopsora pachyrhizi]
MFHDLNYFAPALLAFACLLELSAAQEQRSCSFYTGANTTSATCNEQPNVVCTKGCTGPFVTATECTPVNESEEAIASTQVCSFGFGRNTAAAKACINELGTFRCTGQTTGSATCDGCQARS